MRGADIMIRMTKNYFQAKGVKSNDSEKIYELSGFIRFAADTRNNIIITLENASITRRIYKYIKEIFSIQPKSLFEIKKDLE